MTYFAPGPDRNTGDNMALMQEKFDNLVQVLLYDPTFIIKTYIKDLYAPSKHVLGPDKLLMFPLNLFVVPGLLLLVVRSKNEFLFLLLITMAQLLLVNFKAYEDRYYLFLLPIFGAAVAECFRTMHKLATADWAKFLIVAVLVACVANAGRNSFQWAWENLHSADEELAEVVPQAKKLLPDDSVIIARKPHLGFYTGRNRVGFPQLKTLDELRAFLGAQPRPQALYIYYGSAEQRHRAQFAFLKQPDSRPDWLELVAQSSKPGGWVIYRYKGGSTASE